MSRALLNYKEVSLEVNHSLPFLVFVLNFVFVVVTTIQECWSFGIGVQIPYILEFLDTPYHYILITLINFMRITRKIYTYK